ncbi:TldD/PmbA family protein [Deinococcus radiodurans]|jgi:Predicted Zn-dependent proteases and their inactivated homologs|nr:TldD/PmbA family protein [Deinococcus radiodurans]QIP30731.1 TldD/PmbA family protein [Deinococcus radiodurans]QIP33636.1 TldD/PmbA family protein [Deinococcus radiodurans]UTA52564.1 TldD/PmbA family protein [Deinococcus radiodurans]
MADGPVAAPFMRLSSKLRDDLYEEVRHDKTWHQRLTWSRGEWTPGSLTSLASRFERSLRWNKVKPEKENFDSPRPTIQSQSICREHLTGTAPEFLSEETLRILTEAVGSAQIKEAVIDMECWERTFLNSEGCSVTTQGKWFDFYASYNTGAALVRWRDGTSTQEEVSRLARPPLPILGRGVTWSEPRTIDTVRYDLVLLSPTASSVVIHELIGHGCEHFREKIVGLRVGPEELRVVAFPKNGSGFDDEGTPSEEIVLVENGIVRHAVRDRATGGMAPFSGLTKVASHGVKPGSRCTHLKAEGESSQEGVTGVPAERTVWIEHFSAANYHSGRAFFRSGLAWVGSREELLYPLMPFTMSIDIYELASLLWHLDGQTERARSGLCNKDGEFLPTFNFAPKIALRPVVSIRP